MIHFFAYMGFVSKMQNFELLVENHLFDHEGDALKSYRLGLLKKGLNDVEDIKLIKLSDETKPICDMVDDMFSFELVLIPTTQIHPKTGRLTDQP
jgi:hypothetical protein